jgi:hypothetical protein
MVMVEATSGSDRFDRAFVLWSSVIGFAVFTIIATFKADTSVLLMVFVVAPALLVLSIPSLIYAAVRRRHLKTTLGTLAILWAMAACSFLYTRAHPFEIRESAKWLLWSRQYKQQVLAQPSSPNGDLKHMEWESSGFAGIATNISYLVFDPTGTLSATTNHRNAKLKGVPCEVRAVRRLENHWYAVLFYTDQVWDDDCGADIARPRSSSVLQDPGL